MQIEMAHLRDQGIDFAVFNAEAPSRTGVARQTLLRQLTAAARGNGLKVDKSALAFNESGRTMFFGAADLVRYLASGGVPKWTHTLDV